VAITAKADDPDALAIIVGLQDEFGAIIRMQARKLNGEGYSWRDLSAPLGLTRQSAHTRYADTDSAAGKRKGGRAHAGHKLSSCPPASAQPAVKSSPE
jgi:hypothetical protein